MPLSPAIAALLPSGRLPTPFLKQTTILHGGDYNPDQWLPPNSDATPTILVDDARLMQVAGINSATIGVFSWTTLEPEEGKFDLEPLARVLDAQHSIGNRVVLATPTGAMPAWLGERYPEVRRVDEGGLRAHWGNRHNHCWTSPAFRERAAAIIEQLVGAFAGHPALAMWHVSNELNGQCYCDLCRAEWAKWLERRYGTLAAMNEAHWASFWSHQATAWHHVEPTETVLEGRVVDWLRFNTDQVVRYYNFEADLIRPHARGLPITTNFMGAMYALDYQKLATAVDVVCDDQYPTLHPDGHRDDGRPSFKFQLAKHAFRQDLYRNFRPRGADGQPTERTFFLMEACPGAVQWNFPQKLKRPGIHRLEMLSAIAGGADGTSYFQFRACRGSMEKFHGSVVGHAGTARAPETRMFQEVAALSESYKHFAPLLGTSVRPEVAIVYDWESAWAQRTSNGTDVPEWRYAEVAAEQYLPFWEAGIPVDIIPPDRDFSQYKVLILPQLWIVTPDLAQRLRNFAHAGGTIVATFDTGMSDASNRQHQGGYPGPSPVMTDLFGLWVDETDRLATGTRRPLAALDDNALGLSEDLAGSEVAALPHLTTARALATYACDWYAGAASMTHHRAGQGHTYYVGTRLDAGSAKAFYTAIQRTAGLQRVIDADLPEGVTAQLRGAGEEAFIFLFNHTAEPRHIPLGSRQLVHLESNIPHEGELKLSPFAAEVFRLA